MYRELPILFDRTIDTTHVACMLFGRIAELQEPLVPPEPSAIEKAVPKRRQEFKAGRTLARSGLAQLGHQQPRIAIPALPDRSPAWPAGFTGSITHTDVNCACAIARTEAIAAVGIDMEVIGAVGPELWEKIFSSTEQADLQGRPIEEQLLYATLFFCAKEAFFKLQYTLTSAWLDFSDVTVTIAEPGRIDLAVKKTTPAGRIFPRQQGYYQMPVPDTVLCQFLHST